MRFVKRTFAMAVAATVMCAASTSCSNEPGGSSAQRVEIQLTPAQKVISDNNVEFSISMFKALNALNEKDNVLAAPFSTSTVLSVLANGSTGTTNEEIINALKTGNDNAAINEYYKTVLEGLQKADRSVTLKFANSVWLTNQLSPEKEFSDICTNYYSTPVSAIDFTSDNALNTINNWVKEHTGGVIEKLFDQIGHSSRFCITNACYFNGKWKTPFKEDYSRSGNFKNHKGFTENVMYMNEDISVSGLQGDSADIIELPYGKEAFVMDVIVPHTDINSYISSFNTEKFQELTNGMKYMYWHLSMPRFKAKFSYNLIPMLKKIGVKAAFQQSNDFDAMAKTTVKCGVDQFVQKSAIEVSEEGTKVVVATGATGLDTYDSGYPFEISTPFIYVIRETSSNTILFIGKVQSMKSITF